MRDGVAPRDVKREDEAMSITLRQVADTYFARPGMLKESTRAEMDRHIEQVFVEWKDRPIASLTPTECRKRFEEMATKGHLAVVGLLVIAAQKVGDRPDEG